MMEPSHGLSPRSLATIRDVLQPFARHIERVALFGSRATGRHTPTSDIDLVLFGDIDEVVAGRIALAFEESLLPFSVDIVSYRAIADERLRDQIDRAALPLFSQHALEAGGIGAG